MRKPRNPLVFLAAAAFVVTPTPPAKAGLALVDLSYDIQFASDSDSPDPADGQSLFAASSQSGPLDSGVVNHFAQNDFSGGPQLFGTGRAIADFTSLRAVATAFLGGNGTAHSSASFVVRSMDTITVDAPGMSGQAGAVRISYQFEGGFGGTDPAAFARLTLTGGGEIQDPPPFFAFSGDFSEIVSIEIPVTFNSPFQFETQLIGGVNDGNNFQGSTVDLFNTASLDSVTVMDAQDNLLSNASVTGASGSSYGSFMSVPEPSRLVFLAIAIATIAVRRTRRSRAAVT